METKIKKFREAYFPVDVRKKTDEALVSNAVQESIDLSLISPFYQKRFDFYFESKIMKELIPFVAKGLKQVVEVVQKQRLIELEDEKQIFMRIFEKFDCMTSANEEKKDILGSDYISESENESELKSAFSPKEIAFLQAYNIDLKMAYRRDDEIRALKKNIMKKYVKLSLSKYFTKSRH